jgi:parallel beta-helix repeat protein
MDMKKFGAHRMKKIIHIVFIVLVVVSGFAGILTTTPSMTTAYTPHDPIYINGDADFAIQAASEGWPGDGSEGNPYIIEGYEIIVDSRSSIEVKSTTVSFIIRDSHLQIAYYGVYLDEVSNSRIYNCTLGQNGYGIYLNSSNNNIIANNTTVTISISIIQVVSALLTTP